MRDKKRGAHKALLGVWLTVGAGCHESAAPKPVDEPSRAATTTTTAASPATAAAQATCSASCVDARHAKICGDDGKPSDLDCGAKGRRCVRGVCAERVCKPSELHCDQGQLYRCDESGSSRTLVTACRPDGVCLPDLKGGPAKCVKSCEKSLVNVVLASYDCAACDFKGAPFCAKTGPETTCSESVCQSGELSFGAGISECYRDTDGLIVPGSEERGACEKGAAKVRYEVCVDGKPEPRTRFDGC